MIVHELPDRLSQLRGEKMAKFLAPPVSSGEQCLHVLVSMHVYSLKSLKSFSVFYLPYFAFIYSEIK